MTAQKNHKKNMIKYIIYQKNEVDFELPVEVHIKNLGNDSYCYINEVK